jgi:ribosome-associated translation inhibitor RaiA
MRTTTADIRSLLERVDRQEIRLPEIQRAYVWKPAQIAGLLDSLYRKYPSGSLLLWETDLPVSERSIAIAPPSEAPLNRPQYLLDGQQRLTSLHRVFQGHPNAEVVFNVEEERFQIQSAATKKDVRWITVHAVLSADDVIDLVDDLSTKLPHLERKVVSQRLGRLRAIGDYSYFIEVLDNLGYEEVTEIFVRVNSRGRPLKTTDLALATLSARWPGTIERFSGQAERWEQAGFPGMDFAFLARTLAALATESRMLSGFASADVASLSEGWDRAKRGVEHLVLLLKQNARILSSDLIPSMNALVPVAVYLGLHADQGLSDADADALVYWLFAAFVTGRFSQAADSAIAQDALAVRSDEPIRALFRNLGLLGARVHVSDDALAGRSIRSPYFLLSYLAAGASGARDWWFGLPIGIDATGAFALEYHHIHPQARLRKGYGKAEINDLANLAFISGRANRKISDREPSSYLQEISADQRAAHMIPEDSSLWTTGNYPEFVRARRRLLAASMNDLLDRYRPAWLAETTAAVVDPIEGDRLDISFHGSKDDPSSVVSFDAATSGQTWSGWTSLGDLQAFLNDLDSGLSASLPLPDAEMVDPSGDPIVVTIGPFAVTGSTDDWRVILDREFASALPIDSAPSGESAPWAGQRVPFPVTDSD